MHGNGIILDQQYRTRHISVRIPCYLLRVPVVGSSRGYQRGSMGNVPPEVFHENGIAEATQDTFGLGAMVGAIFAKDSQRCGLLYTDNMFCHEASRTFWFGHQFVFVSTIYTTYAYLGYICWSPHI